MWGRNPRKGSDQILPSGNTDLEDVDVVEVVADGAREGRLAYLLQLGERQGAAGVRLVAVLVPEPEVEKTTG